MEKKLSDIISCYKEIEVEEHKKETLKILLEVDEFCRKHNLTYFLAYGTLIGAIRHKGFIPWDDDIDIWMPRPDYRRMIEIFNRENENSNLRLISPDEKISRHTFAKITNTETLKIEYGINYKNGFLGIDIDVFPLDGQVDDVGEYKKIFAKKKKIYLKHFYSTTSLTKDRFKRNIVVLAHRPCSLINKAKMINKVESMDCDYHTSRFVGSTSAYVTNIKNRHRKECFDGVVNVEFEGYTFPAPIGYDEVLRDLYGDYMQLPPEAERITHHLNKIYVKKSSI